MTCACGCGCSGGGRCGCCEGIAVTVPLTRENRAGLARLDYRIGTHGSFLASLKARLTSHEMANQDGKPVRPLAALRVREGDASISLLDAWATVGDVLTFYQERIANEGYLRTATEARSLHELAVLPGYAPRPGVSASTHLAYEIDPNSTGDVLIPAGTRAQTVPGQDETPQSFETADPLVARAAWNRLPVRRRAAQQLADVENNGLWLAGTTTRVRAGQPLLLSANGARPEAYRVLSVTEHPDLDSTQVLIEPWVSRATERLAIAARAPRDEAVSAIRDELMLLDDRRADAIATLRSAIGTATARRMSPPARRWLDEVDAQLATHMASAPLAAGKEGGTGEATTWSRLLTPPSTPLSNASKLPRDAARDLGAGGGGALSLVGAASPLLAKTLGAALAGYQPPAGIPALRVFAPRVHAGLFGRSFPRRTRIVQTHGESSTSTATQDAGDWSVINPATESDKTIYLDAAYDGVLPGSWVMIDMRAVSLATKRVEPADDIVIAQATDVFAKLSRAAYGQSGDTTEIVIDTPWLKTGADDGPVLNIAAVASTDDSFMLVRRTAVHAASEELALADAPVDAPVCDGSGGLELDTVALGLEPGRLVAFTGERADIPHASGVMASEVAMIAAVSHSTGDDKPGLENQAFRPRALPRTTITLEKPLAYCYRRDTLQLLGNVVRATHGQTRREPLGNGDAMLANQGFVLKHAPVTYLPEATPAGAASSVAIHVDDIAWRRAESFVDRTPGDRIYMESVRADGTTIVRFGDGAEGARLPTGMLNVDAVYREGIGKPGNARAGQISQLADRPLGVRGVSNPVPGTGGADPEAADLIRGNIPIASASLGRLVAVRDYADFARGFAGIEKATATTLPVGRRRLVHVTLAGIDDIPIDLESDLTVALRSALRALGDPMLPIAIATRTFVPVVIQARVAIDADRRWERVSADAHTALYTALAFHARAFGQSMAASEVTTLIQRVPGVARVKLDLFGALPAISDEDVPSPAEIAAQVAAMSDIAEVIPAASARLAADGTVAPAQIVALLAGADQTVALNQWR